MKKNIISHLNKEKVNQAAIFIFLAYYLIGLLSYITVPIPSIYNLFTVNSGIAVGIRAILIFVICVYSLLVLVVNGKRMPWKWFVIIVFFLLGILLSIILSPQEYNYVYVESLYKVVHLVRLSPGITKTSIMYLSTIADFAFAFCALFILPITMSSKKQLLFLLIPIIVICFFECCYSIIKEKDIYLYLIRNPDDIFGGYGHEARATFASKEDWGAFLTLSFVCSTVSSFIVDKKKKINWFICIVLWLFAFCLAGFALLSLCKTAMAAIAVSCAVYVVCFWYLSFKKNKTLGIAYSIITTTGILFIIAFFCVEPLHNSGICLKVYNYLNKLIFERLGTAFSGRQSLWLNYVQNMRGYNYLFGLGKAGVNVYTKSLTMEGQSAIHNGFAYFLASYGLIGFFILIIFLIIVVIRIFKLWKVDCAFVFPLVAAFVACFCFVFAEAEVLVVSTSTPIFVYNVMLVIFPLGYRLYNVKGVKNETIM